MNGSLERQAIYAPKRGEILVVRGTIGDQTTQWAFRLREDALWVPGITYGLKLMGVIEGAKFAQSIDERIANQRKTINLLLAQLKDHCPQLQETGKCPHMIREES